MPEPSAAAMRQAQNEIAVGKQERLAFKEVPEEELKAQKRRRLDREHYAITQEYRNFYVLDTETNGFPIHGGTDEPIQVVALLYRYGEIVREYQEYFLPEVEVTDNAQEVNGWTKESLKERGAKKFSLGASKILTNFLNEFPKLKIVAHNVKYDRDDVLEKAYERVGNKEGMPSSDRWECTIEISRNRPDLVPKNKSRSLDSLLKCLKLKPRTKGEFHDAHLDCVKAAEVYEALKAPKKK